MYLYCINKNDWYCTLLLGTYSMKFDNYILRNTAKKILHLISDNPLGTAPTLYVIVKDLGGMFYQK